jgi:hypothetical protein
MLCTCASTWQEKMKVIENESMNKNLRRREARDIKGAAIMAQIKLIANYAAEVEEILKDTPRNTSTPGFFMAGEEGDITARLSSGQVRPDERDETRLSPIEELKIQILRLVNTVNSRTEVNMR